MSQTIDDKIVALEFDNSQFEPKVEESLNTLQKLKKSLKMDEAAKNLTSLNDVAKQVDLTPAVESVNKLQDGMLGKLSTLKIAVGSALGNIFSGLTKDLIIDPISQSISGGIARSQKIADAKFQLEGLGIAWERISDDIDYAVSGTAFGLDSAAKAASQFAASGVELGDKMKTALRAISGVAAMGASTYDEIAPIFTKAAGQNRVMADELNRISVHGLSATAELAKFFNTIESNDNVTEEMKEQILSITKGMKVSEADIRDFASKSKISFDIFAKAMDEAFGEHAKDANKTFSGSMDNMKAALNRIGEDFRTPIMDASVDVFNALRKMIDAIRKNLKPIAEVWTLILNFVSKVATSGIDKITELVGKNIDNMINIGQGFKNVIAAVGLYISAIGSVFRKVFGGSDSPENKIKNVTKSFEEFTRKLVPTNEKLWQFREKFANILLVLKSLHTILSPIIKLIGDINFAIIKFAATLLGALTTPLAALATFIAKSVKDSKSITEFFHKLGDEIMKIIPFSEKFKTALEGIRNTISKVVSSIIDFAKIIGIVLGTVAISGILSLVSAFQKLKSLSLSDIKNQILGFIDSLKELPVIGEFINNLSESFDDFKTRLVRIGNFLVTFFVKLRGGSEQEIRATVQSMTSLEKILTIVKGAAQGLITVLGALAIGAMKAFNTVYDFIKNFSIEKVIDSIKEFVSSVKEIGLLNTLTNKFNTIGGKVGKILISIVDHIKEFIQEIKDSGSILDFIMDKLAILGEKLIDIKDKISSSLFGTEVSRGVESSGIQRFLQMLGEKLIWLKNKASDFFTTLIDEGALTKTLMIAYVLAILRALITFTTNSRKITKALTEEGGFIGGFKGIVQNLNGITGAVNNVVNHIVNPLDSLSKAIEAWGEAQKKSAAENFAIIMKSFAISIIALAGSLALLYFVIDDMDKFKQLAIAMGIFIGAMAVVAGTMTVIASTKLVDQSFFNSFAANIISMSICIGLMGLLVNSLAKLNDAQMLRGFAGLVGILAAFLITQSYLSRISKAGVTIVTQLKGVLKVAGEVALAAASLSLIAAGILLMAIALKQVQKLNLAGQNGEMDNLIMGIAAIGMIFAAVIVAARFTAGAAIGILQISGALALLGLAALQLVVVSLLMRAVDVESLLKMGAIMIVLSMIFGLLAKGLGGNDEIKGILSLALAIQMLTIAMLNLSLLALLMRNMDLHDFDKPMIILLVLEAMLAILTIICSKASGGLSFKPLVTMIVGLTIIFGELLILSVLCSNEKTFYDILKATGILGGILLAFALVIAAVGSIKTGKSWAPLLVMLGGIAAIFAGVIILAHNTPDDASLKRLIMIIAAMGLLIIALMKELEYFLEFAKKMEMGRGKFVMKAMAAFGIMVGAFVTLLAALSVAAYFIDGSEVAAMAITIGIAMIALAYAAEVIIKSTKKIKWNEIGKATAVMFILVAVVSALALALGFIYKAFDQPATRAMSTGGKAGPILALMLIMGELTLLAMSFKKIGKIKLNELIMATAVLGALTVIFMVVAGVLALIGTLPVHEGLLAKSQIIILVLAELVAISAVLGFIAGQGLTSLAALPTLAILTAVFLVLGTLVTALGMFGGDATELLKKTQIVMLVLTELIAIEALLGVMATLGATAMLSLPTLAILLAIFLGVSAIAAVLNQFGGDSIEMLKKTQIVMLILAELIAIEAVLGAMAVLGVLAIASLPALLGLVLIFGAVGLIVGKINELDLEGVNVKIDLLTNLLWKLVGIMAVMALLSAGAVGELAGAASLLMIAAALIPLTIALQNLQNVDLDTVANGLQLLSQALGMLVTAGVGATVLGAGLIVMALGIGSVGVACMIAAPGITALALALMALVPAIAMVGLAIGTLVSQFSTAFDDILTNLADFPNQLFDMLINGITGLFGKVYETAKSLGKKIEEGFRDGVQWHSPIVWMNKFFMQMGYDVNENTDTTAWIMERAGEKIGGMMPEGALKGLNGGLPDFITGMFNFGAAGHDSLIAGLDIPGIDNILVMLGLKTESLTKKKEKLIEMMRKGQISSTEFNNSMKEIVDTMESGTDAVDELGDALEKTGNKGKGAASAMKDFQSTLTDTLTNQLNIFSKFEQKNPMNKDELLNNMKSQIKGMTDWSNNMAKLAQMGIDQGLYKKLAEMGPQGAEYVGAFVSMSAEELGQANELWAESLVLPGAVAKQIGVNMNEVGQNTLIGFQNGLDAQTNQTLTQLGVIANDGVNKFAKEAGCASPSWKFFNIGLNCMAGLINGIDSRKEHLYNELIRICNTAVELVKQKLAPEKFEPIGADVVNGLKQGIESVQGEVITMLEELGAKMLEAIKSKKALDEESPSHAMEEIGEYAVLGLVNGINNKSGVAVRSITDVGSDVVSQMKSTIASISQMINNEMEDPVITPVLDLSKVQAGARLLNSTFSANAAIAAGQSQLGALQNGQYPGGNVVFNQYNNSPKALSRIDIYRDTRNMLSQFKQATT